jgi:hypothetical protein
MKSHAAPIAAPDEIASHSMPDERVIAKKGGALVGDFRP